MQQKTAMNYVLQDWLSALRGWRFWLRFGILDINLKYRRTYLGPFWITLSFCLTAAGLAFVYSTLFKVNDSAYIAYLVAGLAVWMFVSGIIIEGTSCLMRQSALIRESNLPVISHAFRAVVSGVITFLHNLVIVIGVIIYAEIGVSLETLLILPGMALLLVNAVWISLFFGLICSRYRDLPPLISTITNLMFLITPVFWYRDMLGGRALLADVNPFYHLIELIRAPVLGNAPDPTTYIYVCVATVVGWGITFYTANRFQVRLAFWI